MTDNVELKQNLANKTITNSNTLSLINGKPDNSKNSKNNGASGTTGTTQEDTNVSNKVNSNATNSNSASNILPQDNELTYKETKSSYPSGSQSYGQNSSKKNSSEESSLPPKVNSDTIKESKLNAPKEKFKEFDISKKKKYFLDLSKDAKDNKNPDDSSNPSYPSISNPSNENNSNKISIVHKTSLINSKKNQFSSGSSEQTKEIMIFDKKKLSKMRKTNSSSHFNTTNKLNSKNVFNKKKLKEKEKQFFNNGKLGKNSSIDTFLNSFKMFNNEDDDSCDDESISLYDKNHLNFKKLKNKCKRINENNKAEIENSTTINKTGDNKKV